MATPTQAALLPVVAPLLNGDFWKWDRGTSFALTSSSANQYTANRWRTNLSIASGDSLTLSRQALADGAWAGSPQYCLRFASTQAEQNANHIAQRIEGARQFGGRKVTLEFYHRLVSGSVISGSVYLDLQGTSLGAQSETFVTTGTWQKYRQTFDLQVISSTPSSDWLEIGIGFDAATNYTAEIAAVRLYFGDYQGETTPTHFAAEEVAMRRYYRRWNASATGQSIGGIHFTHQNTYGEVPIDHFGMRAVPTLAVSSYSHLDPGRGRSCTSLNSLTQTADTTVWFINSTSVSGDAGTAYALRFSNASAWFELDAEL